MDHDFQFEFDESDFACDQGSRCTFCPLIEGACCMAKFVAFTLHCCHCHELLHDLKFADCELKHILLNEQNMMKRRPDYHLAVHLANCTGMADIKRLYLRVVEESEMYDD